MIKFITFCIREEWEATTRLGRVLWVPLFAVLLPLCMVVALVVLLPLYLLCAPVEYALSKITKWIKKSIYK